MRENKTRIEVVVGVKALPPNQYQNKLICGPVHIASVSLVAGFSFRKEGESVFGHVEVVNDDKCSPTTRNAGSSSILWFLHTSHSTSELSAALPATIMSYINPGYVLRDALLYYLTGPSPSPKPLEDVITKLPANDYAIVLGKNRMYIALRFDHDYRIDDPSVFTVDGIQPKMMGEDLTLDVFENLRRFGVTTGPHQYKTTSLLGE